MLCPNKGRVGGILCRKLINTAALFCVSVFFYEYPFSVSDPPNAFPQQGGRGFPLPPQQQQQGGAAAGTGVKQPPQPAAAAGGAGGRGAGRGFPLSGHGGMMPYGMMPPHPMMMPPGGGGFQPPGQGFPPGGVGFPPQQQQQQPPQGDPSAAAAGGNQASAQAPQDPFGALLNPSKAGTSAQANATHGDSVSTVPKNTDAPAQASDDPFAALMNPSNGNATVPANASVQKPSASALDAMRELMPEPPKNAPLPDLGFGPPATTTPQKSPMNSLTSGNSQPTSSSGSSTPAGLSNAWTSAQDAVGMFPQVGGHAAWGGAAGPHGNDASRGGPSGAMFPGFGGPPSSTLILATLLLSCE